MSRESARVFSSNETLFPRVPRFSVCFSKARFVSRVYFHGRGTRANMTSVSVYSTNSCESPRAANSILSTVDTSSLKLFFSRLFFGERAGSSFSRKRARARGAREKKKGYPFSFPPAFGFLAQKKTATFFLCVQTLGLVAGCRADRRRRR